MEAKADDERHEGDSFQREIFRCGIFIHNKSKSDTNIIFMPDILKFFFTEMAKNEVETDYLCSIKKRSTSIPAIAPVPAATIAWR